MKAAFKFRGGWHVLAVVSAVLMVAPAFAQRVDEESSESLSRGRAVRQASEGQAGAVDAQDVARRIIEQSNAFRETERRPAVSTNRSLAEAAQYFADYMARTDRYGHTADGKRPAERAREHGYELCLVTENIAYQFSTRPLTSEELARRFVEGWKNSPEHRDNLLDRDVTETGVAIAHSRETDHYYAVQMFGRPKELSIEVRVENRAGAEVTYELADREFALPPRYIRTHQHCRPMELKLRLPQSDGGQAPTETVRIESDSSFAIVRGDDGALLLQREAPPPSNAPQPTPNRP